MDVVIPVRPGDNQELRFVLRSIAANLPHDRVWIIGHQPPWVTQTHHVDTLQNGSKYANTTLAMREACKHPDISDPFIWTNDDIYAMQPVDGPPGWHRGTIRSVARTYRTAGINSPYVQGMIQTNQLLREHGHPNSLSYELHVPLTIHKRPMLQALDLGQSIPVLHKRSVYGNIANLGGTQHTDVKVYETTQPLPHGPWLSSADNTFRLGLKAIIAATFPQPSRHELG